MIDVPGGGYSLIIPEKINEWIRSLVKDKSFVDIGGVYNSTLNEKVIEAYSSGAKEVTMIDLMPFESHWWEIFNNKCKTKNVPNKNISANIDNLKIGKFDVTHCSGLLYHCPSPIETLNSIYNITNEYFILGTIRVPSNGEDDRFPINVPNGGLLLLDSLDRDKLNIIEDFYEYPRNTLPLWGNLNIKYSLQYDKEINNPNKKDPWYNLYTDGYLEFILKICGFDIIEKQYYWPIKSSFGAVYYLTKKIKRDLV
jgi:hypothetical protein